METKVRQGTVTPYVLVNNAESFISFMRNVFGASEIRKVEDGGKILHAEIELGGSIIMLADNAEFDTQTCGFNINVENVDETYNKAIENGAEIVLEPEDRVYGRSAGVRDPFGNLIFIRRLPEER